MPSPSHWYILLVNYRVALRPDGQPGVWEGSENACKKVVWSKFEGKGIVKTQVGMARSYKHLLKRSIYE